MNITRLFSNRINGNFATNIYNNRQSNVSGLRLIEPLKQDTFTFQGNKELNSLLMQAFENQEVCRMVHKNGEPAATLLTKRLNEHLDHLIVSKSGADNDNPDKVIQDIVCRVKGPHSIREKVAGELHDDIINRSERRIDPYDDESIKSTCGDLIGARVILKDSSHEATSKVIDGLIEAIRADELNITKISNNKPKGSEGYFRESDLKKLAEAVNVKRKAKGLKEIKINQKETETGYTALHLDIDLADKEYYKGINDNYRGEIQILGKDVETLKEVEDLCYKINSNKSVKADHIAYQPFVSMYTQYLENTEGSKEKFLEYTNKAYKIQKDKKPLKKAELEKMSKTARQEALAKQKRLPSIEDCNMTGELPPQLDFNKLLELKKACDKVYAIMISENK